MSAKDSRSYHHGNLRHALLSVALERLEEVGPEQLSLRALARDIGVSQTAPYRHFGDKRCLLVALAAEGLTAMGSFIDEASRDHQNALDQLVKAGHAYVHFASENPALYRLIFGSAIDNPMDSPEMHEAAQQAFQRILSIIQRGCREGHFAQEDPQFLAMSCWSSVHGVASLWIDGIYANAALTTKQVANSDLIDGALRTILMGILARP